MSKALSCAAEDRYFPYAVLDCSGETSLIRNKYWLAHAPGHLESVEQLLHVR